MIAAVLIAASVGYLLGLVTARALQRAREVDERTERIFAEQDVMDAVATWSPPVAVQADLRACADWIAAHPRAAWRVARRGPCA